MTLHDTVHGFVVEREVSLPELDAVMYQMKHEKTGLELVWISREEENKVFGIGFETLPWNDTGVFHILEHSVLCGSKNYPVKEPFVELLKNSMNTFLNAMTFPDKTFYPVASRNDKDFVNLMRVYLDAVFYPAVYTKPEIFYQEGWHYEFDSEGKPGYKGVVFNEMKGAFADADELMDMTINRALFPDTPYRYVSGGDPTKIPDLTYEEFIESHKRFYSPSNAYVYLDGAMDIDAILGIINDEYLSSFEQTKRMDPPTLQSAVDAGEQQIEYEIGADENEDGKIRLSWGRVIGTYAEREKLTAMQILSDVLTGNNQAPLTKAVLEDGLAETMRLYTIDGVANPWVKIEARNVKKENCKQVEKRIFDTLNALANGGLDHEKLEASMANLEFQMRERDYGSYPQGLILGMQVFDSWLYGGAPEANLQIGDLFVHLREKMKQGYFEHLIREELLENPHRCKVALIPSKTAGEARRAKEAKRIEDESAMWSDKVREEIIAKQERLEAWQNSEDTPEQLAALPHLELSDLSRTPQEQPIEELIIDGQKVLVHRVNSSGIVYITLYFDENHYTEAELPALGLLCRLFGNLETTQSSVEELNNRVRLLCGSMTFFISTFNIKDDSSCCTVKLCASFSTLESNVDQAVSLAAEILTQTRFDTANSEKAVLDLLRQIKMGCFEQTVMGGHAAALGRVSAQMSVSSVVSECTGGVTFYQWLKAQEENWNWNSLLEKLTALYAKAVSKEQLTISLTGNTDAYAANVVQMLQELLPSKPDLLKTQTIAIKPWGIKKRE
ncbi:MAG: insulinase family protein [Lachnospiraceae bacterium]